MQAPDVVVLVPGFLGFSRLGGFYYFAELPAIRRLQLARDVIAFLSRAGFGDDEFFKLYRRVAEAMLR